MVSVGLLWRAWSNAVVALIDSSLAVSPWSPTTATRSPPDIPLEPMLVLAMSELANAKAITARNASVRPTPSLELMKLRKKWIMG